VGKLVKLQYQDISILKTGPIIRIVDISSLHTRRDRNIRPMIKTYATRLELLGKGTAVAYLVVLGLTGDWLASLLMVGAGLLGLLAAGLTGQRNSSNRPLMNANPLVALIYPLIQKPDRVALGLIGGMTFGAIIAITVQHWPALALGYVIIGGLLIAGILFGFKQIHNEQLLRPTSLSFVGISVGLGIWLISTYLDAKSLGFLSIHLLLGIVVLYLLVWIGRTEETEAEVSLACVLLGLALWCFFPGLGYVMGIAIPLVVYLAYTQFMLHPAQSFHAELQGLSAAQQGDTIQAMSALRHALELQPRNRSARAALWQVHRQIDLHEVHQDERLLKLIDFDMCLQRARDLLFADQVPANAIQEAKQLLNLVADQRPEQLPAVLYYRAVAHTHERDYDKAEADLSSLLDPAHFGPDQQAGREGILLAAWQLALTQHGELKKRVGEPLLQSGKRMDAIAAVEKRAKQRPLDEVEQELKKLLYSGLTLEDYNREAGAAALQQAMIFDHKYLYERALECLDDADTWQRGADWLRIAVRGQPRHAPAVMKLVAEAAARHGQPVQEAQALAEVKAWAKLLGVKELSAESKTAYFSTIWQLGESAYREGRLDEAIENLVLCIENPDCAADTLRLIAECYEKKGDVLNTLWYNEQCLLYDAKNTTDLERRSRVYYSLNPDDVRRHAAKLEKVIDQKYLSDKSKELLELKNTTAEQHEWGRHLAEVLIAIAPDRITGWVLLGRAQLRLGQSANAVEVLEKAYQMGKSKKPGGDDQEDWYLACRILGDYYLQQERFAEALACFSDYRQSTKSGADTLFKLGQAAERLGELTKAKNYYEHANMFDHPNKYEVNMALDRIASRN
jgi:tetratricopeptide (TPR) repeat protein